MRFFTLPVIVILGLVAYRLARVIAHDKIGEPLRKRAYAYKAKRPKVGGWLNALTTCPFCLSVYFAAGAVAWTTWMILPTWPGWGEFLLAIPAAAGVAAILAGVDMALTTYVEK
jgi:hypothetical protein